MGKYKITMGGKTFVFTCAVKNKGFLRVHLVSKGYKGFSGVKGFLSNCVVLTIAV